MIYEFICECCGYIIDLSLPVKERNKPQKCPQCDYYLQRQIGCPGLVFKGTGFYTTDVLHKKTMKKQALKEKKARDEGKSGYKEI